jgi:hypothetical protein
MDAPENILWRSASSQTVGNSQHSVKKEARLTFDIIYKEYSGTFTEGKCSEMTSLGKVQAISHKRRLK